MTKNILSVLGRIVLGMRTPFRCGPAFGLCSGGLVVAAWLAAPVLAGAQSRPYLGYVYPAGGQQGTVVRVRFGGQGVDDASKVLVSGAGLEARVIECRRRLNNQEVQLLNDQIKDLKRAAPAAGTNRPPLMAMEASMTMQATMMSETAQAGTATNGSASGMLARLEQRVREYVQQPACASIASLVEVEVTVAADAHPGPRELRLVTARGVSNPIEFQVSQLPEHVRPPMLTSPKQILGKEAQALRNRPTNEIEVRVALPCAVNGQIASGEVNRYRFNARKGQRLVMAVQARQLVPYIADAVPGWFQPVLELRDARGAEVAFCDDNQFRPDPTLLYAVPADGEYVLTLRDSIYRGREDFVYRITLGEWPWVTSVFPLGGKTNAPGGAELKGWNLEGAQVERLPDGAPPGLYSRAAVRRNQVSNRFPFALDTLPEAFEKEPNNTPARAQKVTLPVILNGRVNRPDDGDVYQFTGQAGDTVVAEVLARRLDSPLDAVLKLTDARGTVLAFNDDHEDMEAGMQTHHADAYLMARLPADGVYDVHLSDTARQGGEEFGYRLRLSAPRPDFSLRVIPSSLSLRAKSSAVATIYVARKDGFAGPIKLVLAHPPAGFSASPVTLLATQTVARLTIKTTLESTPEPVSLSIAGSAKIQDREVVREAVPAEDRMQAFLWRHLVPARDLVTLVFDPSWQPPPKRQVPAPLAAAVAALAMAATNAPAAAASVTNAARSASTTNAAAKPKFTPQQINGRLKQLKLLYDEGLLTAELYAAKVAECQTPP